MKVVTTFEQYVRAQMINAIDFRIRAEERDGVIRFYIHPLNVDGDTLDFEVKGNALECVSEVMDQA